MSTMKKHLLLFLFACLLINAAKAQQGGNPKYDPDANPYEHVLDDTAIGKRTAKFLKNFYAPEWHRDKFYNSPCNGFVELGSARIAQFQAFVLTFLAQPSDAKQMKAAEVKYAKEGFAKIIDQMNYEVSLIEKQGTHTGNTNEPMENLICRVRGSIQFLKNNLAYAEAVKKIFPTAAGAEEAIQIAKAGISKYGDQKTAMSVLKENKEAAIADVFLPKAVTKNEEWEGWFANYFTENFPGYTILRQSLLSVDWYIKKNAISGLPEYRQIGTAIAAKAPDGKCKIIKVDLYQDYLGGKYGQHRFQKTEELQMRCKNLNE